MENDEPITSFLDSVVIHTGAFRMTDDEFERFCLDNPELRIERSATGEITIMSPSYPKTGIIINLINIKIGEWCLKTKSGYIADSSSGFYLPDGSMRSPDVAWIPMTKWKSFTENQKNSFLRYCPDFIVEVKSKSDRLQDLKRKMQSWIDNGTQLGWLIDPDNEKVWIYKKDEKPEEVNGFDKSLSGENVLQGFTLFLKDLRVD
jgi:Uma2 family endonuclease